MFTGLLQDRIRLANDLAQSASTKSDPGWFCTILSGTSVEERDRSENVTTELAFRPDEFSQVIQIGSGSVLHSMAHAFFGKTELKRMREVGSSTYDPARFWLYAGRNGRNWP